MKNSILLIFCLSFFFGLRVSGQKKDSIPPTITILGGDTLKWEVLIPLKDPGVKLKDDSTSDSVLIKRLVVKSNVNINKTDTYQVQYDVKDLAGNAAKTKTRIVMVIDTVKPVISLKGEQGTRACQYENYTDQGYTLTDNYDKATSIKITTDGTFKDTKNLGLYRFRYVATDSHKNIAYSDYRYILVQEWGSINCEDWLPQDTTKHSTGIEDQKFLKRISRIFPNPADEQINIEFKNEVSGGVIISLMDQIGRQINFHSQALMNSKTFQIPTSNLPNGIYFLNIQSNEGNFIEKVEIRH